MGFYKKAAWPAMRHIDAEFCHYMAICYARAAAVFKPDYDHDPRMETVVAGIRFPTPFGLAAGLDKTGEMFPYLSKTGFGFADTGTVTLFPQKGNPRPRLFRVPEHRTLVNRMGLNGPGADAVAKTMEGQKWGVPRGVSIAPGNGFTDTLGAYGMIVQRMELTRFRSALAMSITVLVFLTS